MKKISLTYGLLSGAGMGAMYTVLCLLRNSGNAILSQVWMYAAVVFLFIMVFAGIKSYRDNTQEGFITFGEAFKAGMLISLVSVLCYTLLWLVLFDSVYRGFMEQHAVLLIEKLKASGTPAEQIASKKEELLKQIALYSNPLLRMGIIFIQGFPVEAVMALIASFLLRKKREGKSGIA